MTDQLKNNPLRVSKHAEAGSSPGGQLAMVWMLFSLHLYFPVNPCTLATI